MAGQASGRGILMEPKSFALNIVPYYEKMIQQILTHKKRCATCGISKTYSGFPLRRRTWDGLNEDCKSCACGRQQKLRRKDPEKFRGYELKSHYKLSLEQYNEMLAKQDGVCSICKTVPDGHRRNMVVDHDHKCCPEKKKSCGKCIRGLICDTCNRAIGMLGDCPKILRSAAAYLESSPVFALSS